MFYFAYGSNMNRDQMRERCPRAKFIKRAYLENYQFVYDGYSDYREGAVANIVEKEGSIVWGALYEIDEACLSRLDQYEGYPRTYNRKILRVKDDSENEYEAHVYLRKPQKEGEPSDKYRNIVVKGARECGFPEDYIKNYLLASQK